MVADSKDPRFALLLGAGASVDAGCPSVRQLTSSFSDFLGDHDRRLIPVYEWLLEALDQADSTGPDPDIELVLSSARDSSPLAPFVHR